MLPVLVICACLLLVGGPASGALDDCPTPDDDADRLLVTLKTFYDDLVFVKAVTETRRSRDYSWLIAEMRRQIASRKLQLAIERAEHELLHRDWNRFSRALFIRADDWACRHAMQGRSYFNYLEAEAHRLMGDDQWAINYIQYAIGVRHQFTGVSINELFKLHGLVELQIVAHFNKAVDRLYGLKQSPNMRLLSALHAVLRHQTEPLDELRSAALDRLYRTAPAIELRPGTGDQDLRSDNMTRLDPHVDDISGQSVSGEAVDAILCEFAQKLSTLGLSSPQYAAATGGDHFDDVLEQLARLDADFAAELNAQVVSVSKTDPQAALSNVETICKQIRQSLGYFNFRETFARYLRAELYLSSEQSCHAAAIRSMQCDLDAIKYARMTRPGVSIGKIVELEGRIVYQLLGCFHRRLKWAYELDGTEDADQLEAKRDELGTCERKLPRDGLDE